MTGSLIVLIILAILILIIIAKTAIVVPQQSAYVVERLGRYSGTISAGFHVLLPFVDTIRYRHSLKEIAIDVKGLTKSFDGRTVVRNLSLQVPKGEIYGFLGPNGSGKTTTLRLLCGLLTPDAGEGTCLGYDILTEQDAIKRNVGYMTQRFSLYADLSIRENLEFVARVYGVANPKDAANRAILQLGLAGRADQLAGAPPWE